MRRNAVIFACDHNYFWPALLAANAIRRHASNDDFDLRIFSASYVPDGWQAYAEPGIDAETLSMGDFTVKTGIGENYYSMATFLRLFALKAIENEYDRILYLDADIAVRHGDVCLFWNADLNDRPVAAVRDWFNWGPVKPLNARYMSSLGVSSETGGYFNSGFLLVDAQAWAREGLGTQVFDFLDQHPELCRFHDQSALNYILKGRWAEVSPRWNWQTKVLHHLLLIDTRDPHLIHFNARRKPWRDRERLIPSALKDPLIEIADKCGWDAFEDEYSKGPMRPRKEMIRATTLADLWTGMPAYLKSVWPYLSRDDFIDIQAGGPDLSTGTRPIK